MKLRLNWQDDQDNCYSAQQDPYLLFVGEVSVEKEPYFKFQWSIAGPEADALPLGWADTSELAKFNAEKALETIILKETK